MGRCGIVHYEKMVHTEIMEEYGPLLPLSLPSVTALLMKLSYHFLFSPNLSFA